MVIHSLNDSNDNGIPHADPDDTYTKTCLPLSGTPLGVALNDAKENINITLSLIVDPLIIAITLLQSSLRLSGYN